MQITVTGRHGHFGDGIREYVTDKAQHDLGVFPRVESVHVILNTEKHRHQVEVVVQGKNHLRVDGHAESDHVRTAVDEALDKAARQLRRERDKIQEHRP